jgi:hypothetical protein
MIRPEGDIRLETTPLPGHWVERLTCSPEDWNVVVTVWPGITL